MTPLTNLMDKNPGQKGKSDYEYDYKNTQLIIEILLWKVTLKLTCKTKHIQTEIKLRDLFI